MPSIPFELYPLILEHLPLKTLKKCSLTNHTLHELVLPFLFRSVTLRDYFTPVLAQLTFFNRRKKAQVTRFIQELHLNIYSMAGTTLAAIEYKIFFTNVAPQLRVLDIGGRLIRWKFGDHPSPKEWETTRNLLVQFIPRATSLVSLTIGEASSIPLAELVTWCPSVRSLTLINPDKPLLNPPSRWKRGSIQNSFHNLQSLTLQSSQHRDRASAFSTLTLVGQSINLANPGASSAIKSLSLHGFDWLTKEEVIQFVGWLFSPETHFDNLREIHFPPVVFYFMGETSSPVALSSLPTLKTITFIIGTMTDYVSQQWPVFFEWLFKVLSAPHSLEKLNFEVSFSESVSDRDLMMMLGVCDRMIDSLPELTFVLILKRIDRSGVICGEAFPKWLKYNLPTLSASGKLNIIHVIQL
ncbi:hypothetical protein DL96DRAFT_1816680 [Flagelloscypha sp. PMI_526]|nr:hypothetical protein DL96DRAFT_1816680 [Flagelloscypha sp. PMI_526]